MLKVNNMKVRITIDEKLLSLLIPYVEKNRFKNTAFMELYKELNRVSVDLVKAKTKYNSK